MPCLQASQGGQEIEFSATCSQEVTASLNSMQVSTSQPPPLSPSEIAELQALMRTGPVSHSINDVLREINVPEPETEDERLEFVEAIRKDTTPDERARIIADAAVVLHTSGRFSAQPNITELHQMHTRAESTVSKILNYHPLGKKWVGTGNSEGRQTDCMPARVARRINQLPADVTIANLKRRFEEADQRILQLGIDMTAAASLAIGQEASKTKADFRLPAELIARIEDPNVKDIYVYYAVGRKKCARDVRQGVV